MVLKVWYKDRPIDKPDRYEDVIELSFNYNGVGDIQFVYGKYHSKPITLFAKDIERFLVL